MFYVLMLSLFVAVASIFYGAISGSCSRVWLVTFFVSWTVFCLGQISLIGTK